MEGLEIVISADETKLTVSAMRDDEVVEEFEVELSEEGDDSEEGEDLKAFGDMEEEGDFEDMEMPEGDDDDEDDDDEEEGQLESFQSFIKKRK
jgi:hypothetical protein